MSSAGNGLTTQSLTRVFNSSSRNFVRYYLPVSCNPFSNIFILALPSDIVPATFKKKRTTAAPKAKGEDDDEKPTRATEEGARPTGLGRGQRWAHYCWWVALKRHQVRLSLTSSSSCRSISHCCKIFSKDSIQLISLNISYLSFYIIYINLCHSLIRKNRKANNI